jgi:hypothetical protein
LHAPSARQSGFPGKSLEQGRKLAPGNFPRTQGSQVGRFHLTVYDAEIMGREEARQMGQCDLGGVGLAREHGLAIERPADGDAIQAPRQFRAVVAFDPGFE